jgi:hypothetical protein
VQVPQPSPSNEARGITSAWIGPASTWFRLASVRAPAAHAHGVGGQLEIRVEDRPTTPVVIAFGFLLSPLLPLGFVYLAIQSDPGLHLADVLVLFIIVVVAGLAALLMFLLAFAIALVVIWSRRHMSGDPLGTLLMIVVLSLSAAMTDLGLQNAFGKPPRPFLLLPAGAGLGGILVTTHALLTRLRDRLALRRRGSTWADT